MAEEAWIALAFVAGLAAAIAHFKSSKLGCFAIVFALPCAPIVLLDRPDSLFDEPFPPFLAWAVFAFPFMAWASSR